MRQTRVRRYHHSWFRKHGSGKTGTKIALFSSVLILSQLATTGAFAQSSVVVTGYTLSQNNTELTVKGQGFGSTSATVTIDGQPATVVSWSPSAVTVSLSAQTSPGSITVTNAQGLKSNSITFLGVSRGYYTLSSDGTVTAHGQVPFYGDLSSSQASSSAPAIQLVPTPDYQGYWILTQNGHIYSFGDASSLPSLPQGSHSAVSMAVTPSGQGAFVLTASGTVHTVGQASNYGNASGHQVVSIASTADGKGYWIVTKSGDVLAFGDAKNYGSLNSSSSSTSATSNAAGSVSYSNGTLLQQKGTSPVWVVENGTLHHIPSAAMFLSMGFQWSQIQRVSSLSSLSLGLPLVTPYPSGTLLQVAGQPAIYVVMQGVVHHIGSWSTLVNMGLGSQPIVKISQLGSNWPMGPTLNSASAYYPSGTLLHPSGSSKIYMVNQGVLHHIVSGSVFSQMGYQWNQLKSIHGLPNMSVGSPLTNPERAFPTGSLVQVQGHRAVYLVQNGVLRHITSPQVLHDLGYHFSNVIQVPSSQVISGLQTGSALGSTNVPGQSTSSTDPSSSSTHSASPAVDLVPTLNAQGYWILQSNGTVTAFGDAKNYGQPSNVSQATELVPSVDQHGYDVITAQGQAYKFGDAPSLSVPSGAISVVDSPMSTSGTTSPSTPTQQINGFLSMGYGFFVDNFPNGVNNSSYEDLLQHGNQLSAINPAWFNLSKGSNSNWTITSWSTQGSYKAPDINGLNNVQYVTQQAHQQGVLVLPSIGNYYSPANGPITTSQDVTSMVNQIVTLVNHYNFDGITIDFENNGSSGIGFTKASQQYTNFIQKLGTALHQENKLLMVAVYPSSYPNTIYNYAALAHYANFINMMAYPEHNSSTWPGPTAGYPWVSNLVKQALAQGVNPNQIILGVAPYGHEWTVTNSGITGQGAVSYRNIQGMIQKNNIQPMWDSAEKEMVFTTGSQAQAPSGTLSTQNTSHSNRVANLQNILNLVLLEYAIKNNQSPRPWLWANGHFNSATQNALEAFQQDFSVNPTTPGVYGPNTAKALQQVINQWNVGQNIYWTETARSIQDRVQLALKSHLGGIAAWRLPFESSNYWTDISQQTSIYHNGQS